MVSHLGLKDVVITAVEGSRVRVASTQGLELRASPQWPS